jgi:hypothetical protein
VRYKARLAPDLLSSFIPKEQGRAVILRAEGPKERACHPFATLRAGSEGRRPEGSADYNKTRRST